MRPDVTLSNFSALTALLFSLVFVLNCSGESKGEVDSGGAFVIDTLGGILWVENPGRGLWHRHPEKRWRVREVFRLGGVDGPPETTFGTVNTSVSSGPQGDLFVLDNQAERILVFDRNGKFVKTLGGPGGGPGEFDSPAGMGWDGLGRLWIANGFNGRYTVFDSAGTLEKTLPRPIWGLKRLQFPLVFDGSGRLIDEGLGPGIVPLVRVDTTGAMIDTLPPIRLPDRPRGSSIIPPGFDRTVFRYLPELVWAYGPDETLWLAETGSLRLVQRTLGGDTIRVVHTQHRQAAIDPKTSQRVRRELSKIGIEADGVALARPILQGIHVMDDGHVLVQIVEEVGGWGSGTMDVFDPEGRFLGSLSLGFRLSSRGVPALVGDTIVGIHVGKLDVPFLVRAEIQRPRSWMPN